MTNSLNVTKTTSNITETLLQSIMQTNVNTSKIACAWPLIRAYGRWNTSTFLLIQSGIYNRSECDLDLKRKYMYIKTAPCSRLKMNIKYMSVTREGYLHHQSWGWWMSVCAFSSAGHMVAFFVTQLVLSSRTHQFFPVQNTSFMYLKFFFGGEGGSNIYRYGLIWPKVHLWNLGIWGTDSVIPLTLSRQTSYIHDAPSKARNANVIYIRR